MVEMSHGPRARTRKKLRKRVRERGLPPITRALQKFEIGEKAAIVIDPSIHKGMPFHRFHGLTGDVVGKRGRCYLVRVRDGGKYKIVIAHPYHLRKVKS